MGPDDIHAGVILRVPISTAWTMLLNFSTNYMANAYMKKNYLFKTYGAEKEKATEQAESTL